MADRVEVVNSGVVVAFGANMARPFYVRQTSEGIFINDEINDVRVYPTPPGIPAPIDQEEDELQELLGRVEAITTRGEWRDYDELADLVSELAQNAGYEPGRSSVYGDVFVETETGESRILTTDRERIARDREAQEPDLDAPDACVDSFFDQAVAHLNAGGLLLVGHGFLKLVPPDYREQTVDAIASVQDDAWAFDEASTDTAEGLADLKITAAVLGAELDDASAPSRRAVIFFQSDIWDKPSSRPCHPCLLAATGFMGLSLDTTLLENAAITPNVWRAQLRRGAAIYYNMSYGDGGRGNDDVLILVGSGTGGQPTHRFTASHVRRLDLSLPNSLIYNYSCRSLANPTMANAFLDGGASVYLGWTDLTRQGNAYINRLEKQFWGELNEGHTVGAVVDSLHRRCVVPHEWGHPPVTTDFLCCGDENHRIADEVS